MRRPFRRPRGIHLGTYNNNVRTDAAPFAQTAKRRGDLKGGLAAASDDDGRTPARGGYRRLHHAPQLQERCERLDRPDAGAGPKSLRVVDRAADIERDHVEVDRSAARQAGLAAGEIDPAHPVEIVADALGGREGGDIDLADIKVEGARKRTGRQPRIEEGRRADQMKIDAGVAQDLDAAEDMQMGVAGADQN